MSVISAARGTGAYLADATTVGGSVAVPIAAGVGGGMALMLDADGKKGLGATAERVGGAALMFGGVAAGFGVGARVSSQFAKLGQHDVTGHFVTGSIAGLAGAGLIASASK